MEDLRKHVLHKWLTKTCLLQNVSLEPMPGDASFRRYYRVFHTGPSFVAMDAHIERDACLPFIAISKALRKVGLLTPEIICSNVSQGFLLLTDFGDIQLLKKLSMQNASNLYSIALNNLHRLQSCRQVEKYKINPFTAHFMQHELVLAKEWFLETHLKLNISVAEEKMLETLFCFLALMAKNQPQVFMHRDFHSANIMCLNENTLGILDFQDAFYGPLTYDLVSLLKDCYIDWPEPMVTQLALSFLDLSDLKISADEFLLGFDLMGMQRHLKALMTFSRKLERDKNPNYLQFIPRTLCYLKQASAKYAETQQFHDFLCMKILPATERVVLTCVP